MKALIYLIALCSFVCTTLSQAALFHLVPQSVEAKAWVILDPQSEQVIAEYNSHEKRAPASMTKMMVAYITLQEIKSGHLPLDTVITATPVVNTVQWDESQMYIKPGQKISVDQLLAGLIVMSANDAAVLLAEHISGSVPAFVQRMNQEAQAIGMKDTHFSNPAGITMDDHYSTAYDMALLGQAVSMQTPYYLHYSIMPSFTYDQRFHRATNLALKTDPSVDGLKTGFTKAAGYNLALTAHRPTGNPMIPERRLIVVVMGAANAQKRAEVASDLMNLAYTYTRNEVIVKPKQAIASIPVVNAKTKLFHVTTQTPQVVTASLYNQQYAIDLKTYDKANNRIMLNLNGGKVEQIEPLDQVNLAVKTELTTQELTAPLNKVLPLANIVITQDQHALHTIKIAEKVEIEEASFFQKILNWFSSLWNKSEEAKVFPLR